MVEAMSHVIVPSVFFHSGGGGLEKKHTGSWFLSVVYGFFGYKVLALGYIWLGCNRRNTVCLMSDLCHEFSPGLEVGY